MGTLKKLNISVLKNACISISYVNDPRENHRYVFLTAGRELKIVLPETTFLFQRE